jgi:hypothetical protein
LCLLDKMTCMSQMFKNYYAKISMLQPVIVGHLRRTRSMCILLGRLSWMEPELGRSHSGAFPDMNLC